MWQFFQKEPEAVQIRPVARNRLQNLFLRAHSLILKLCQTSGVLFLWRFGVFCYLTLASGFTRKCALVYRGRILCKRLLGEFCKVTNSHCCFCLRLNHVSLTPSLLLSPPCSCFAKSRAVTGRGKSCKGLCCFIAACREAVMTEIQWKLDIF